MGYPLVTKTEYKAYAGLVSPNEDARINALIPKVSDLAKSICRRTFIDYVDDIKVEYSDGGYYTIPLEEYPLINVSSVEYSADYGTTYTSLVAGTDYIVSKTSDNITALTSAGFPAKVNGYKVTYTAGYETLPEDLKLAIFDLITYYLKNDSAIHSNKAPGTNTVQIEYVTTTNLPAHIKRVFDLYTSNYS